VERYLRLGIPEQHSEALLLEMMIVRQNVRDPFTSHCLHGNAIRQAVTLVRPRPVKFQAAKE
jgi:hypothetical protein